MLKNFFFHHFSLLLLSSKPILGQKVCVTSDGVVVATQPNGGLLLQNGLQNGNNEPTVHALPPGVINLDDISIPIESGGYDAGEFLFALSTSSRAVCSYSRDNTDLTLIGCLMGDFEVLPFSGMSAAADGVIMISGGEGGITIYNYDITTGEIKSPPSEINRLVPNTLNIMDVQMAAGYAALSVEFAQGSSSFGSMILNVFDDDLISEFPIQDFISPTYATGVTNFPLENVFFDDYSIFYLYTANGVITAQSQYGASSLIPSPLEGFLAITLSFDVSSKFLFVGGLVGSQSMILKFDVRENPLEPSFVSAREVEGRITSIGANNGVLAYARSNSSEIRLFGYQKFEYSVCRSGFLEEASLADYTIIKDNTMTLGLCEKACDDMYLCLGIEFSSSYQGYQQGLVVQCKLFTNPIVSAFPSSTDVSCLQKIIPTEKAVIEYHGSNNAACRGGFNDEGSPSDPDRIYYYDVYNDAGEVSCQNRCSSYTFCFGYEYKFDDGRCEIWKKEPKAALSLNGYNCKRKVLLPHKKISPVPTEFPTNYVTPQPTPAPTKGFIGFPTRDPTTQATKRPSPAPTKGFTKFPTKNPTIDPTTQPTKKPLIPSSSPSSVPSSIASSTPSLTPSSSPSSSPSSVPSPAPTLAPFPLPFWCGMPIDNSNCITCDNRPIEWAENKGIGCRDASLLYRKCNRNAHWGENRYCQLGCYNLGVGYEGDKCCIENLDVGIDDDDGIGSCIFTPTQDPPTKDPTPQPTKNPAEDINPLLSQNQTFCFSGETLVETYDHHFVKMKDLSIGQKIRSSINNQIDTVYGWAHIDHVAETEFLKITFEDSHHTIEVTPNHLIFQRNSNNQPVAASKLQIGDHLANIKIEDIEIIRRKGFYAPLTTSGQIPLVLGIDASCYVTLDSRHRSYVTIEGFLRIPITFHTLGHLWYIPCRISEAFGMKISESILNLFSILTMKVANLWMTQNKMLQVLLLALLIPYFICLLIFDFCMTYSVLYIAIVITLLLRVNRKTFKIENLRASKYAD